MRYSVNFYIDNRDSEKLQVFLDQNYYGEYSSQYPIDNNEGFDTVYSIYSDDSKEAEALLIRHSSDVSIFMEHDYDVRVEAFEDKDWQEEWKKFYEPLHFGSRLSVLPAWKDVDVETNESVVKIDPGMAFGTGSHGSTFGCLLMLEKYMNSGLNVLDMGCGSAILAIAASKLGVYSVDAVEIDSDACKNAIKNIKFNNVLDTVNVFCGSTDVIPQKKYDLIIANITADVIKNIYDKMIFNQSECKNILFSGISDHRKDDFETFMKSKNLNVIEHFNKDSWNTYFTEVV